VVLAEDNETIRSGIKKILTKAQDIQVVGEAKNGVEALQLVNDLLPDIVLLDVEMPLLNGLEVARQLKKAGKNTRVLVLSAYNDLQYIQEMLVNGAAGYLIKEEAPERIVEAVRGVAMGETGWVSPQVRGKLDQ
jgi:DNA-binding NarL/FixJ family response regulator